MNLIKKMLTILFLFSIAFNISALNIKKATDFLRASQKSGVVNFNDISFVQEASISPFVRKFLSKIKVGDSSNRIDIENTESSGSYQSKIEIDGNSDQGDVEIAYLFRSKTGFRNFRKGINSGAIVQGLSKNSLKGIASIGLKGEYRAKDIFDGLGVAEAVREKELIDAVSYKDIKLTISTDEGVSLSFTPVVQLPAKGKIYGDKVSIVIPFDLTQISIATDLKQNNYNIEKVNFSIKRTNDGRYYPKIWFKGYNLIVKNILVENISGVALKLSTKTPYETVSSLVAKVNEKIEVPIPSNLEEILVEYSGSQDDTVFNRDSKVYQGLELDQLIENSQLYLNKVEDFNKEKASFSLDEEEKIVVDNYAINNLTGAQIKVQVKDSRDKIVDFKVANSNEDLEMKIPSNVSQIEVQYDGIDNALFNKEARIYEVLELKNLLKNKEIYVNKEQKSDQEKVWLSLDQEKKITTDSYTINNLTGAQIKIQIKNSTGKIIDSKIANKGDNLLMKVQSNTVQVRVNFEDVDDALFNKEVRVYEESELQNLLKNKELYVNKEQESSKEKAWLSLDQEKKVTTDSYIFSNASGARIKVVIKGFKGKVVDSKIANASEDLGMKIPSNVEKVEVRYDNVDGSLFNKEIKVYEDSELLNLLKKEKLYVNKEQESGQEKAWLSLDQEEKITMDNYTFNNTSKAQIRVQVKNSRGEVVDSKIANTGDNLLMKVPSNAIQVTVNFEDVDDALFNKEVRLYEGSELQNLLKNKTVYVNQDQIPEQPKVWVSLNQEEGINPDIKKYIVYNNSNVGSALLHFSGKFYQKTELIAKGDSIEFNFRGKIEEIDLTPDITSGNFENEGYYLKPNSYFRTRNSDLKVFDKNRLFILDGYRNDQKMLHLSDSPTLDPKLDKHLIKIVNTLEDENVMVEYSTINIPDGKMIIRSNTSEEIAFDKDDMIQKLSVRFTEGKKAGNSRYITRRQDVKLGNNKKVIGHAMWNIGLERIGVSSSNMDPFIIEDVVPTLEVLSAAYDQPITSTPVKPELPPAAPLFLSIINMSGIRARIIVRTSEKIVDSKVIDKKETIQSIFPSGTEEVIVEYNDEGGEGVNVEKIFKDPVFGNEMFRAPEYIKFYKKNRVYKGNDLENLLAQKKLYLNREKITIDGEEIERFALEAEPAKPLSETLLVHKNYSIHNVSGLTTRIYIKTPKGITDSRVLYAGETITVPIPPNINQLLVRYDGNEVDIHKQDRVYEGVDLQGLLKKEDIYIHRIKANIEDKNAYWFTLDNEAFPKIFMIKNITNQVIYFEFFDTPSLTSSGSIILDPNEIGYLTINKPIFKMQVRTFSMLSGWTKRLNVYDKDYVDILNASVLTISEGEMYGEKAPILNKSKGIK